MYMRRPPNASVTHRIRMSPAVQNKLTEIAVYGHRLRLKAKDNVKHELNINELKKTWHDKTKDDVVKHPMILAYINLNHLIGLKGTPPSTQNIIQRCLISDQNKFPVIHPIVDLVNVAAIESLVPLGVFDANCVRGDLQLDYTIGGEIFTPIGGKNIDKLPKNVLVLKDNEKVLSKFGSRDSDAQKITHHTNEVWLLACKAPGIDKDIIAAALQCAIDKLEKIYDIKHVQLENREFNHGKNDCEKSSSVVIESDLIRHNKI